ncbi:hypothetical protein RRG08_043478 [Elysia crispata]|uniref:Uncharacterized protein n=1 Tax=Elysia crispata TaxID=231223 RepID=A0AAE1CXU8_9GAST|nr:hypothetical protein RRG08_043478 [Elysia crispata]
MRSGTHPEQLLWMEITHWLPRPCSMHWSCLEDSPQKTLPEPPHQSLTTPAFLSFRDPGVWENKQHSIFYSELSPRNECSISGVQAWDKSEYRVTLVWDDSGSSNLAEVRSHSDKSFIPASLFSQAV